jgi:hypothetical protein
VLLVVRPHWVLSICIRIVSVLHGDVAIPVATLAADVGRYGIGLGLLWCQATLILIVFVAGGRLRLQLRLCLAIVVVSSRRLTSPIVSSGTARWVRVGLPLIHGGDGRKRPTIRQ